MNEVTIWIGAGLVLAQIAVAIFTALNIRATSRKTDAESDVSIPVDAANQTTTASLALVKELREEIKRSKEECGAQIKLLEEEIKRLKGRIKELEGKSF